MTTQAADYLNAIEHLPAGATLTLQHIGWDEYEEILRELADKPGLRATYDKGRLEIMSPLLEHEEYKGFIHDLVRVLSEELSISLETRGSATFKAKQKGTGVEPDDCFYVQNAFRIIGKREIDLSVDPPPDVAVEIDVTSESLSKFPIYAALGVLELWRYDGQYAQIYELAAQTYSEVAASRFFPLITAAVLGQFIEESKTDGQSAVLVRFREWVRASQT